MTTRYQVAITLAFGLVLITAALVGLLAQAPDEVRSTNYITGQQELGLLRPHATVCQADERLPASTAALRMSLIAYIGPAVSVTVSRGGQIIASGHRDAGWVSGSLTLPLQPRVATPQDVKICLTRDPGVGLAGSWRYRNAIRQIDEFLIEHGGGRFHQYLRLSWGGLPQSFQNLGEPLAAPPFIRSEEHTSEL